VELDVRGSEGVPKGTELRQPDAAQLRAIESLQDKVSTPLVVQYNGLTATPRHLFSHEGYLSEPSSKPAEVIARDFLHQWRGIWQFEEADLKNLRLKSRATVPDTGTTILLFEQHVGGISVHKGEVLVNVSASGQILSVGGENFPKMRVSNTFTLTPAAAVNAAAQKLDLTSRGSTFHPDSVGATQVLRTYGDLPQEFTEAERFRSGDAASDDIIVQKVIFPLGSEGRAAYKLTLTTPQYDGIMWENIVDASTGEVLRRISLTAFQAGGGVGPGRQGTLRPDVQDLVESFNAAGTSAAKSSTHADSSLRAARVSDALLLAELRRCMQPTL
jgi:Zn-dependent metalloprotease